ncbi:hypothetical protein T492DRAFT_1152436, partial [Pavlovales sp. CCMP2436]
RARHRSAPRGRSERIRDALGLLRRPKRRQRWWLLLPSWQWQWLLLRLHDGRRAVARLRRTPHLLPAGCYARASSYARLGRAAVPGAPGGAAGRARLVRKRPSPPEQHRKGKRDQCAWRHARGGRGRRSAGGGGAARDRRRGREWAGEQCSRRGWGGRRWRARRPPPRACGRGPRADCHRESERGGERGEVGQGLR